MISWALKRNSESARDAPASDDTTQIEQPDTPAPVFAVRALKTALFGTPAPRDRRAPTKPANEKVATQENADQVLQADKSPAKPAGILLTPGTGTTRRKRVSFGHDVKQGSGGRARTSASGLPDDCPGKFPSPWVDRGADSSTSRPKTKLQQALENSRNNRTKEGVTEERDFAYPPAEQPEAVWEEDVDESDYDCDVTTDLNEPHSRSGKYWKSFFETYHTDAKAEMEKLVKYKQLAKSYARMKDAEALDLNQKLREEQEKVRAMEEKIAEMSRQAAFTTRKKGGEYDTKLVEELTKQTALAIEYKKQVDELEALLREDVDEATEDKARRPRRVASPRTQQTLMETQRELRRARSQARELEKLQEERDRLKSELRFAEQRATKLAEENRKLSKELSQSATRIQELEKRLEDSKSSYDRLKEDAKARYVEAHQVLQKKNEKITELQEEIGSLKREGTDVKRSIRTIRAKSYDGKATTLGSLETEEAKNARESNRPSIEKRLSVPASLAETRQKEHRDTDGPTHRRDDDTARASSRTLKDKFKVEPDTKVQPTSSVLSDRGNLQDSRSSASSGRSAHAREDQPHTSRTDRAVGSTRARASEARVPPSDRIGKTRDNRPSRTSSEQLRRPAALPPSHETEEPDIDLVQGRFAPLGGTDAQSSAVWSTANASRTTLPPARRIAAIARLQRKKAEREMQQLIRDKENTGL